MENKTYLGDGVYVETHLGMIKLTTSDGLSDTNTISLEGPVFASLQQWHAAVLAEDRAHSVKNRGHSDE